MPLNPQDGVGSGESLSIGCERQYGGEHQAETTEANGFHEFSLPAGSETYCSFRFEAHKKPLSPRERIGVGILKTGIGDRLQPDDLL